MKRYYHYLVGVAFISLAWFGCKSPDYLVKPKDFKTHTKGLYFDGKIGGTEYFGELIAVTDTSLTLLLEPEKTIVTIERYKVRSYEMVVSLTSDDPERVQSQGLWTSLTASAHGWWMLITVPINAVIVTAKVKGAYQGTYRMAGKQQVVWDQLYKFARFPYGLPEGIAPEEIK